MTVIAWDGRTLACDSQGSESDGTVSTVQKIWKADEGKTLIAAAGVCAEGFELQRWYIDGAEAARFPTLPAHATIKTTMIVVTDETIRGYYGIPFPIFYSLDEPNAWGGASLIAKTALHLGKNAREACEIACELSLRCALPVISHDLKGRRRRRPRRSA